jgi:hypothetical protein
LYRREQERKSLFSTAALKKKHNSLCFSSRKEIRKREREEKQEMKAFCACRSVIETNAIIIDDDDGKLCFLLLHALRILALSLSLSRFSGVEHSWHARLSFYMDKETTRKTRMFLPFFFCSTTNARPLLTSSSLSLSRSLPSSFSLIVFGEKERNTKNDETK